MKKLMIVLFSIVFVCNALADNSFLYTKYNFNPDNFESLKNVNLLEKSQQDLIRIEIEPLSKSEKEKIIYNQCIKIFGPQDKYDELNQYTIDVCKCTSKLFVSKATPEEMLEAKQGRTGVWHRPAEKCIGPIDNTPVIQVEIINDY
jgi:hypothetical protein